MRSMTGHGLGEAAVEGGKVVVEVRTVNQRFLEVRTRAGRELADLIPVAEHLVRERVRRGRVDLSVRREGPADTLDGGVIRGAVREIVELRDELGLSAHDLPVGSLLPLVLERSFAQAASEHAREAVRVATIRALEDLDRERLREGAAVRRDVGVAGARGQALAAEARTHAAIGRERAEGRLRERITSILAATPEDAARVEREIALLLERTDATEELNRLSAHLAEIGRVVDREGGEPAGRRLDFLLQEAFREATTLGAKALDVETARTALELKLEIDRMREQVQNLE